MAAAFILIHPAPAQVVVNPQALRQLGGPAPAAKPATPAPERRAVPKPAIVRRPAPHRAVSRLPLPPPPAPVIAAARPALPHPAPKPAPKPQPAAPKPPAPVAIVMPGTSAAPGPRGEAAVKRFLAAPRPRGLRFLVRATAPGVADDPSIARRLALRRGMAVRHMLLKAGIPAERIIVQALGNPPGAPDDRVTLSTLP